MLTDEEYHKRIEDEFRTKKTIELKNGIEIIETVKEKLFTTKKLFYNDYLYSEEIQKVPDPIRYINEAIETLEMILKEKKYYKINW